MRPSRPREERLAEQVERGIAAERLLGDELVQSWFASEIARVTEAMIGAPVSDDQTRRDCAVQLKQLRSLKAELEATAAQGRQAAKQQEKAQ